MVGARRAPEKTGIAAEHPEHRECNNNNKGRSQELRSSCKDEEDDRDESFATGSVAVARKRNTIQ